MYLDYSAPFCVVLTGLNDHRNKRRKIKRNKSNSSVKEGDDAWPISYDVVPRKKRSDLGIAIVRLSSGFTIRNLPFMHREFQRAQEAARASTPQFPKHGNFLGKERSMVRLNISGVLDSYIHFMELYQKIQQDHESMYCVAN